MKNDGDVIGEDITPKIASQRGLRVRKGKSNLRTVYNTRRNGYTPSGAIFGIS